MNDQHNNRRDFIKKAAYIAPAVMTLSAMPSIAQSGSGNPIRSTHGNRPSGASHNAGGSRPHNMGSMGRRD